MPDALTLRIRKMWWKVFFLGSFCLIALSFLLTLGATNDPGYEWLSNATAFTVVMMIIIAVCLSWNRISQFF